VSISKDFHIAVFSALVTTDLDRFGVVFDEVPVPVPGPSLLEDFRVIRVDDISGNLEDKLVKVMECTEKISLDQFLF
jgi:hypothetical protein